MEVVVAAFVVVADARPRHWQRDKKPKCFLFLPGAEPGYLAQWHQLQGCKGTMYAYWIIHEHTWATC